ncbi:hypothetical protein RJ639_032924 [Escallonia herrerae]|uniref:Uncharacterized protein n=1 Tax=Escallonia herrerae TaxID=1293975 RepID=A0AA88WWP4_9ASTE|nr:hypothetical protein RJ639_032924 [Escallonia herrerae]
MSSRNLSSPARATAGSKPKGRKKKQSTSRGPLQDLNAGFITRSNSSASTSSVSSSISVEAPKGCLRFFRSNPSPRTPVFKRPKSLSKTTPKSAPNPTKQSFKPSNENHSPKPTSQKPRKNPHCLYQWQSGKKPGTRTASKPTSFPDVGKIVNDSPSGLEEFSENVQDLKQTELLKVPDLTNSGNDSENCTPSGKLACESVSDCAIIDDETGENSNSSGTMKTPPVQASVSPEIQCGLSMLDSAATPTCYGAGHVLSGITDRRKCRPRGTLTVAGGIGSSGCGKDNIFNDVDENDAPVVSNSKNSLMPLPVEASMSWLLSPCREEDGSQKREIGNVLRSREKSVGFATLDFPSPPSSHHGFPSYLCHDSDYSGHTNTNDTTSSRKTSRKTRITLLSPGRLPELQGNKVAGGSSASPFTTPTCKAVMSQEDRKYGKYLTGENSPFSVDSLGSGNVMQTPKSDSSAERHVGLSWIKADGRDNHRFLSELDSVVEVLRRESLSPRTHISLLDHFQFADLSSITNSIALNHFPKSLDNRDSWISSSPYENFSQSQMRISWREGLVSRIFEMDELDCCRCLSDEENDTDTCAQVHLNLHPTHEVDADAKNDQSLVRGFKSPELPGGELGGNEIEKEKLSPHGPNSCAESICTDGGGLLASRDSNWTLCYRNQLFDNFSPLNTSF